MKRSGLSAPYVYLEYMFYVTKNLVCPRCGKVVGRRQVEYRKDDTPAWGRSDVIQSEFICMDCRRKIEEDIKRKSGQI